MAELLLLLQCPVTFIFTILYKLCITGVASTRSYIGLATRVYISVKLF